MRAFFLLLVPMVALGNPVQVEVGSPEDVELLQQMVKDLFSDREGREISVDDEGTDISTNMDTRDINDDKTDESLVQETDPVEIARFNNYMDAIYRRMNAALRAKLMDPMILNLDNKNDKSKKKSSKPKKDGRKGREVDVEEDEEHAVEKRSLGDDDDEGVEDEEGVDRKGVVADEDIEEDTDMAAEEGEGRKMTKQAKKGKKKTGKKNKTKLTDEQKKKKKEEKKLKKKSKKDDKKKSSDSKKKHGGKHKGRKSTKGKKDADKDKKAAHEKGLARSRRNKHSKNDKNKDKATKKSAEKPSEGKSMGSLAGIATLRRSLDVVVLNADSHKVVKSEFSIGPLQLEVSKTFGKGKSRSVKTAKAITEELTGKMVLKVKPDGSAHVRSVFFHKPEKVEVHGSLGTQKKRSDTYLKNSVGKVRPIAAQRILKMARYVLKSPSTVQRS